MKKTFHIFLLAAIFLSTEIYAQVEITPDQSQPTTDEQLASQYYEQGEYDKAIVYYEKLYEKTPINIYYNYYLNCLIFTKDFKHAEKIVKKQSNRNPGELTYHVDLGRVYQAEGDDEKMKKEFESGIKAINSGTSSNAVINLANAFLGLSETDLAIETYQNGRKELKG